MRDSKKTKAQLLEEIAALQKEIPLQAGALHTGIIASAMDAIIIVDEEHNIVQFNAAAEGVFGYSFDAVRGKPVHLLLPNHLRDAHRLHIRRFGEGGTTSRTMRSLGTLPGLRADGEVISIETSITQTIIDGRKYFAVILRDVSERQNLEDLILRQYDSLNTLHLVTLDLLNRRDIKDLLQFIVDQAVKLLEVSYCEIVLPDGDELVVQAFTREKPFAGGNRFTRNEGRLSWQVFDSGLPAVLDDYSTWEHRHKIYEGEHFHAAAALPLLVSDQCIGVLGMTRDKPGYKFTEEQILTATRLAAIAALAIENSRLLLEVQRLAITDELTGAHNRRSLMELGEREVQRALRYERALSILMLDVDHFKRVNDTWGHPAGDAVLRGVAQEAMKQIRKTDTIGRYAEMQADSENVIGRFGGEEFGILLPESALDGALAVAERIRASIAGITFHLPGQADGSNESPASDIRVTVSLGVSCLNSKTDSLSEMLTRADQALYIAKQSGRNRVCKVL
jgi:diguanylate cyclase (GGDEF)-like protein/PAS domain S-box-containing protein